MTDTELIKAARRVLADLTPIPADCGELCGRACCVDEGSELDSGERGMLLFPGEARLASRTGFLHVSRISPSDCGPSLGFAECRRSCIRHSRPLSCRIFPLVCYVRPEHRTLSRPPFEIILDPRARGLCPLYVGRGENITKEFRDGVRRAYAILFRSPRQVRFACRLSAVLDDYLEFTNDQTEL